MSISINLVEKRLKQIIARQNELGKELDIVKSTGDIKKAMLLVKETSELNGELKALRDIITNKYEGI